MNRLWFLLFFSAIPIASTAQTALQKSLPGHVPPVLKRLAATGLLPESKKLRLSLSLSLRNREALSNLLDELYDPARPEFHNYLTPVRFTEKFSPSRSDYQAVLEFAQSNHLRVLATHESRMVLDVEGSVLDIQKAFHIQLHNYRHPAEPRQFYAPDTEPSVDSTLPVGHILGLSDWERPRPALRRVLKAASATPCTGSAPEGNFIGSDFRNAYAPGVSLTGAGQSVGLLEFDGYYAADISAYESLAGLAAVPLANVYVGGTSGTPGSDNDEVALDIEMAISMAPGLSSVVVFEATNNEASDVYWYDLLDAMASSNQVKQFSSSWARAGSTSDTSLDPYFQRLAAQGQSFFQASGDDYAWINALNPIPMPCASPYVTSVGGTTLSMGNSGGYYRSERVWNSADGGSGGGVSADPIPAWQMPVSMTANQGSSTNRNIPDVALTADDVWVIYSNGVSGPVAGTSCAAPLWAGFAALINQQAATHGRASLGFANPAIYEIGEGTNYTNCFHDITAGNNTSVDSPDEYFAVPGYDLCTGWGTPAGQPLMNALSGVVAGAAGGVTLTNNSLSAFTSALAGGGLINLAFNGTITATNTFQIVSNTTLNAAGYNVTLSGANTNRVFTIRTNVIFSATNLTIANGKNSGTNGANGVGGGELAAAAGSSGLGGAIYNQGTNYFINCYFLTNGVSGGAGGAGANSPDEPEGTGGNGGNAYGGAIYNLNTVFLSGCTFNSNSATGGNGGNGGLGGNGDGGINAQGGTGGEAAGAALYNAGGATATALNCTFGASAATGGASARVAGSTANYGNTGISGGFAEGAAICNLGTNYLADCWIYQGSLSGGLGGSGGIAQASGGTGGTGGNAFGGGLYNGNYASLSNCTFSLNSIMGGNGGAGGSNGYNSGLQRGVGLGGMGGTAGGGACYTAADALTKIYACTFFSNSVQGGPSASNAPYGDNFGTTGANGVSAGGGAIYNSGTNAIINSTCFGNRVTGGAAGSGSSNIVYYGGQGGTGGNAYGGNLFNTAYLGVTNGTISQGAAYGGAAGAGGYGPSGTSGPGSAGSAYGANVENFSGSLILMNSLLASPSNAANASGTISDGGNNLSSDATPALGAGSYNNLNAKLGPLANNGGTTLTLALLPGSPAINAGNDSVTNFLATDQRGFPRDSGSHVDIGAYELQIVTPYFTSYTFSGPGQFQLQFNGTPGESYSVLTSTNPAAPLAHWTVLGTGTALSPGAFQFTDPQATNFPGQFYQLRSQ